MAVKDTQFTIKGAIRDRETGKPLPGFYVRVFDVDRQSEDDFLGDGEVNEKGEFTIHYRETDFAKNIFGFSSEGGPDTVLKVYDPEKNPLHTTKEESGVRRFKEHSIELTHPIASRREGSIWFEHAAAIKKSEVKTIKELVIKLRPEAGKKPLIEGVTSADATEMLIDIGLSSFPFGTLFRQQVFEQFKENPDKVTINNIIASFEKIREEKFLNYLEETIAYAKSGKVQDPFESEEPISEHYLTAPIYKKNIIEEVGKFLGISESKVESLKQRYRTRNEVLKSDPEKIRTDTGISLEEIDILKRALNLSGLRNTSIGLSVALANASLDTRNIIKLEVEELKKKVDESSVQVPDEEKSEERLKEVIKSAKESIPDFTFYHEVISSLVLPQKAKIILEEKNVQTFDELRKNGLIDEVIKEGEMKDGDAKRLMGFSRLERATCNTVLAGALINNSILSVYALSRISRNEFIDNYKNNVREDELIHTHQQAIEIAAKNLGVTAWAYLISRGFNVDAILPKNTETRAYAAKILKRGSK